MRDGLRCQNAAGSRLYHWGLKNVARSTFADANNSRPVAFFQDLFAEMYSLCATNAPKHKFRFKSKLFSLDATTIKLCLSLFPWASFRKPKGGVKIHTLLDHDGHIPAFATVTDAKTHKSRIAKILELPKGSIVVFDKAFIAQSIKHLTFKLSSVIFHRWKLTMAESFPVQLRTQSDARQYRQLSVGA